MIQLKNCPSDSSIPESSSSSLKISYIVATERESPEQSSRNRKIAMTVKRQPNNEQNLILNQFISVDLSNSNLEEFPEILYSYNATLHKLNLSNNLITQLPETITKLSMLRILNMSQNNLIGLPNSLNQLELQELDVHQNHITQFGKNVTKIPLKKLNISSNHFTYLPKSFTSLLKTLEVLNFGWFVLLGKQKEQSDFQKNPLNNFMSKLLFRDINIFDMIPNSDKRKLLLLAIENNEIGVIKLICSIDAHYLTQIIERVGNPLFYAYRSYKNTLPYLIEFYEENNCILNLFLFFVVSKNDYNTLTEAIKYKWELNFQWNEIYQQYSNRIGLLIKIEIGDTLLHLLFRRICFTQIDQDNQQKIAKILIQKGANPNLKNEHGWTPLHLILQMPSIRALRFAIEYNNQNGLVFDFNRKSRSSKLTLLHIASQQGYLKAIHELNIVIILSTILQKANCEIFVWNRKNQLPKSVSCSSLPNNGDSISTQISYQIEVIQQISLNQRNIQTLNNSIKKQIQNRQNNFKQNDSEEDFLIFSTNGSIDNNTSNDIIFHICKSINDEFIVENLNFLISQSDIILQQKLIAITFLKLLRFKFRKNIRYQSIFLIPPIIYLNSRNIMQVELGPIIKQLTQINQKMTNQLEELRQSVQLMQEKICDLSDENIGLIKIRKKLGKGIRLDISNYSKQPSEDFETNYFMILENSQLLPSSLTSCRTTLLNYENCQQRFTSKVTFCQQQKKVPQNKPLQQISNHKPKANSIGQVDASCLIENDCDIKSLVQINKTESVFGPVGRRKRISQSFHQQREIEQEKSIANSKLTKTLKTERPWMNPFLNQKTSRQITRDIIDFEINK